uniref:transposase n=1 Tax=Streptomyces violascens TaxID=67381 RepID=UPI003570A656
MLSAGADARRLAQVDPVDDVSFPKCGRTSAGVARQYCGALGKWANYQVAVSVHAAFPARVGGTRLVIRGGRRPQGDRPGGGR